MLRNAQIMSNDAFTPRKPITEPISPRDRDEIARSLEVIRAHGRRLQRALTAESVGEAELIASLEEIERQTGVINRIVGDT